MNKQNILIGAMAIAIAALGVITISSSTTSSSSPQLSRAAPITNKSRN